MLVQKRDAAGAKTELLWFIGDTQAHYDANGNVTKVYAHVSLGTPVARVERTANATTNLEYQFHGLANNTLATVGTDGTVNTNLVYAPYGELVSATGSGNGAGLAAHWRRFNDVEHECAHCAGAQARGALTLELSSQLNTLHGRLNALFQQLEAAANAVEYGVYEVTPHEDATRGRNIMEAAVRKIAEWDYLHDETAQLDPTYNYNNASIDGARADFLAIDLAKWFGAPHRKER